MNNGKICVSVCAETADELVEQIRRAEDLADVIEIRFDCLQDWSQVAQVRRFLLENKFSINSELLGTFRLTDQGGKNEWVDRSYIAFWIEPINNRILDFEDLEFNIAYSEKFKDKVSRIRSFHSFAGIPKNLAEIYEKIVSEEPTVIKIAVRANDAADSIPIWKLLEKAKADNKQIIPIAMGESGKWMRILGLAHGAFMTYAALGDGKETAPGQISAKDLIEVYRVKELNEQTEIYGILGGNTSVSMSPYMHNAAFKFHSLNAVFVPLQVHDLDAFLRRMVKPETREIALNFKGFSVTIPHKQTIIKHLDSIDETAKKIGAVNTVKIVDGKLRGYNTDAKGFIEPLLNSYGDLTGAKVAVIGAGGAARACVYSLVNAGASVTVFARDLIKAASLAEDFQIELQPLIMDNGQRTMNYNDFDVLVNSTPLGMKGKAEHETPAFGEQIENVKLVYDLVYNPFQTALMQEADKFHVPKIGGLAMLIAQAMEQQKIWTGEDAPLKEMSRAVLERLK